MFRTRENIRIVHFDTIIIVLVIFFGILIFVDYSGHRNGTAKSSGSSFGVVHENYAIDTPVARLQIFQKTWISNKDNFNLLAFNRNPVSENRKTNLKVGQLLLIRQSLLNIPQFIFRYHLFPREIDDPHFLS